MLLDKVSLEETGCFSPIFLDYLSQKDVLKPFYQVFPEVKNFKKLIENRTLSEHHRLMLVDVLTRQYGPLPNPDAVDFNIHSLKNEKTFTVTTGHQLNIFTGPLYFIYKIVTVINACAELKKAYPDYHFVPVYWMASEDHDLDEIASFHLFGKTYTWNTDQKGPVGRMNPLSLNDVIHELPEKVVLFEKAYLDHLTLADAVRFYINELFGKYGLVVLDADHPDLKGLFRPVIEKEFFDPQSNELVEKASTQLNDLGYKSQAFSREINFFYIEQGLRERFVKEGDQYKVLNTDLSFSSEELKTLIKDHPERFSPNVIMRPVYQEVILPNLAYCGGPAEIAYWLQLKEVFAVHNVAFPSLMPRNFALVINKANRKKMGKAGLKVNELFKDSHLLKEEFLKKHSDGQYKLDEEKKELAQFFEKMKVKASQVDQSLTGFVGAEGAKAFKILDEIAKRIKKAEEQKNETALSQIEGLKEKLFPNGGLQERYDNFLSFYLNHPGFISDLLDNFDPFDFQFYVFLED